MPGLFPGARLPPFSTVTGAVRVPVPTTDALLLTVSPLNVSVTPFTFSVADCVPSPRINDVPSAIALAVRVKTPVRRSTVPDPASMLISGTVPACWKNWFPLLDPFVVSVVMPVTVDARST